MPVRDASSSEAQAPNSVARPRADHPIVVCMCVLPFQPRRGWAGAAALQRLRAFEIESGRPAKIQERQGENPSPL